MIVAFEGIDGAGKTTTAPLVAAKLRKLGFKATFSAKRRPGVNDPFADEQLTALSDRLWGVPHDARLDALGTPHWIYLNAAYFAGTHHTLSQQIAPREVVIFDNWINKFLVRICSSGAYALDDVVDVLRYVPQPDMVVLFDVSPALAAERKHSPSKLESGILYNGRVNFVGFQNIVRDSLLYLARRYDWPVLAPGEMSPDELAENVVELILKRLEDAQPQSSNALE